LTRESLRSGPSPLLAQRRPSSPTALAAVQQRDNLCGPFQAARVLREAGVERWGDEEIDQDLLAVRAGSLLPDLPPVESVPAGAESLTAYAHELPVVPAGRAGTGAQELARAIEDAAGGALRAVPLRARWTPERVARIVSFAPELGARLIANLRTGRLWGTRPPAESLLAELGGQQVDGPPPEWDVGHFVELAALIRGFAGSLAVVRDSYPTLGWDGVHLQPPRALAAALNRDDGHEGGVLCVLPAEAARKVEGLGFRVDFWDNGTRR
jgi:hypothetical protein